MSKCDFIMRDLPNKHTKRIEIATVAHEALNTKVISAQVGHTAVYGDTQESYTLPV